MKKFKPVSSLVEPFLAFDSSFSETVTLSPVDLP